MDILTSLNLWLWAAAGLLAVAYLMAGGMKATRPIDTLAGQIRAAHMIGQEEPLKLLLSQRDPAQAGRVLTYYQYFGRARAQQIAAINGHITELNSLDAELAQEEQRLTALEEQQRGEVVKLQSARDRRGRALASLEAESKNRAKELERLKDQQGGLEKLVRELRHAPVDIAQARLEREHGLDARAAANLLQYLEDQQRAIDAVEHAARHWNEQRAHAIHHPCELQSTDAARGQSEIDRAAGGTGRVPHVGHALEDAYRMPTLREQCREQSSGQAGADNRHRIASFLPGAHRRHRPSVAANSHASTNVL